MRYRIPTGIQRTELTVVNSRFITTIAPTDSVEAARDFLADIRAEMPDANHHVYAFRVGYGNSINEGMSDDGEPSGTAGPPVLTTLRGVDIGDVAVVVTRYFGGTKLGTGGLVRAYTAATREGLANLQTFEKAEQRLFGIECPYQLYEGLKRLIPEFEGQIDDESFTTDVVLYIRMPVDRLEEFQDAVREYSAGQLEILLMDDS